MWIVKNVDKYVLKQWWSELTGQIDYYTERERVYILNFSAERLHFLCEVLKIILSIFQYKVSKTHNCSTFLELELSFHYFLPPRDPMLGKTRTKSDFNIDYLILTFPGRFCLTPSPGDIPSTPVNIYQPETQYCSTPEKRFFYDQVVSACCGWSMSCNRNIIKY